MDARILKIRFPKDKRSDGLSIYPWNFLPFAPPPCPCVFDSYRGTVGFDIFPFAVTTRISASSEVFLKVYEDMDNPGKGEGMGDDGSEYRPG